MNEYGIIYIWLTILLLWKRKNEDQVSNKQPLLLKNNSFAFLFKLAPIFWVVLSIYLLFNNWQTLVFTIPILFVVDRYFKKVMWYLEGLALYPLVELYKWLMRDDGLVNLETDSVKTKTAVLKQEVSKKGGWNLIDVLFFVPLFVSVYELLFYGLFAEKLQMGFENTKPSWALATIIVVALNPYKEIIYIWTVIFSGVWIIKSIYKLWKKD
ncbi:MAG: hypothetical protein WA152_01620 [Microgenomates group bacterium]